MALIYVPERRVRADFKPGFPVELDTDHPLYPYLRIAVLFTDDGLPIELVKQERFIAYNSVTPATVMTPRGRMASLSDPQHYYCVGHNSYNEVTSIIWGGELNSGTTGHHFAGKHLSNGGSDNPFDFRTDSSLPPLVNLVKANSGFKIWASTASIPTGQYVTVAYSHAGPIEGAPTFYINGRASSATDAGGAGSGNANPSTAALNIGRRADGAVPLNGKISFVIGFAKVLTADEHFSLSQNPWQLVRPRSRDLFVNIASSGTPYTYTPTGGITFAGAASLNKGKVPTVSGGLTFAGSGTVNKGKVFPVSGGIVFSGTATKLRTKVFSPSGSIVFGGSAASSFASNGSFTYTPTGGITFGGSGVYSRTKVFQPSGALAISGAAVILKTKVVTGNGSIAFAGSASVSSNTVISSTWTLVSPSSSTWTLQPPTTTTWS